MDVICSKTLKSWWDEESCRSVKHCRDFSSTFTFLFFCYSCQSNQSWRWVGRESSSSLVCIQHKQQQLSTDLRASQGNKKQTELGADALRPCQETNLLNQQSQDTESGFSPRLTRLQVFTARIPHSCTELFALLYITVDINSLFVSHWWKLKFLWMFLNFNILFFHCCVYNAVFTVFVSINTPVCIQGSMTVTELSQCQQKVCLHSYIWSWSWNTVSWHVMSTGQL